MASQVLWFRRDLRLHDNPALLAARESGPVIPLFVLDPRLLAKAGERRTDRLLRSLHALNESLDGGLVVRTGDPAEAVTQVAKETEADAVHISAETTPYGHRRDGAVHAALDADGRALVATGSPYAVTPGRVVKNDGTPFKVFTPFSRAWREHGWREPAIKPRSVDWASVDSEELPKPSSDGPAAGEQAARRQWNRFLDERIGSYGKDRNRPDLDRTSRMSVPLKYGELHPRTLLADLRASDAAGVDRYVTELCWREFYADVLWHAPRSAWHDLRPELTSIQYEDADGNDGFEAWKHGTTGFPIVDAGMRQLLGEGWMHNRVRMITASFLAKDLHIWWPYGARHFLDHLEDGDIASNNHGWQWTAGTGTDAAPYFRVFNPVLQGEKFDPNGDYVRRWVPELAHLGGKAVHQPWKHDDGYAHGYPRPIVDHAEERREALARYQFTRNSASSSNPDR